MAFIADDFLPSNYEPPKAASGLFLRLLNGENRLRILDKPQLGYQYWNENNKCVRLRDLPAATPADIRRKDGAPEKIKHFWAMPVWNYAAEQICIWEVTQPTIQNAIVALSKSEEWGSPLQYDLKITKKGEKLETKYNVIPIPPRPLPKEVEKAWNESKIDVSSLFNATGVAKSFADEIRRVQEMTRHTFAQVQAIAKKALGYSINSPQEVQSEEDCIKLLAAMQSDHDETPF